MTKIPLTDVYLRKLRATGVRLEVSDASTVGLKIRVSPTGQISFITKARGGTDGRPKTVTLGRYPDLSLREAREQATQKRLELKAGGDPTADKRAKRQAASAPSAVPTLRALLREFEAAFGDTKKVWAPAGPRTARTQAGRVVERVFASLLDREVTNITEEDCAAAIANYKRLRTTGGGARANGQASRARGYRGGSVDLNRFRAFSKWVSASLCRHRFGYWLVEVGLIGGFPVKR